MPKFEYGTLADREDVQRLGKIDEQCFVSSPGDSEIYFNRIGVDNFRVLRCARQVIGGLAVISMGQWYAGQRVPMAGIASVSIAPEYRGSRAAISLMQHTLNELYSKEVPISVLYPAAQRLYRQVGYEQGGHFCGWEILSDKIQVREQPLPFVPVPSDCEVLLELYQQQARVTNGFLERHQAIWQQVSIPKEREIFYAYLLGNPEPQGYIIFSQHRTANSSLLIVKDWVVLTSEAGRSFWAFLANHRSQIEKVQWRGAAIDSLTLLLPEQKAEPRFVNRWLLRLIDVGKALEKRGYAPGVEAELHLEVRDDLLIGNNSKFILSVSNGRGEVARGGKGELQLDVRGLAPLYTGLFTPYQLQLAGQLEATEAVIATATRIFAGASPWMPDFF